MSMLSNIRAVFHKEALDAARDHRSLMTVAMYSLFGPLILVLVFTALAEQEAVTETLEVPVQRIERLPGLEQALLEADIRTRPSDNPRAEVERGDARVAIEVADTASLTGLQAGPEPATLRLIINDADIGDSPAGRRVGEVIAAYSNELVALRALARGVSPSVLRPLDVQRVDLSTSAERAAILLSGFVVYILLAAFVGAMNLVTDMTAGERERRSLEILLAQPASAWAIVGGKFLAATVMSVVAICLTLLALWALLPRMPLAELGLSYRPGTAAFLTMALAALPLAPMAAGIQMIAASFAKTFKEAQMYLSLSMIAPIALVMAVEFLRPDESDWMLFTPMLGQQQIISQVLKDNVPGSSAFLISAMGAAVVSALCLWITVRLHRREAILQTS